ncbi:MAG TPA: hypothetical protein DHU93_18360, partial [Algoriphagus sp.]|nr:hypothetical protein [Algoriphagus sp.]
MTASSRFLETLDNIVKGLNKAGFSDKDYKLADSTAVEPARPADPLQQLTLIPSLGVTQNQPESDEDITSDIDVSRILVSDDY